jgi:hypothetical protein
MFTSFNFLLPFVLQQENKTIWDFIISVLFELPAIIAIYFIIDTQAVGRINMIVIASIVHFFLFIIFYFA